MFENAKPRISDFGGIFPEYQLYIVRHPCLNQEGRFPADSEAFRWVAIIGALLNPSLMIDRGYC